MADYISQFTGGEIDRRLAKVSDLEAGKQDKLESGENIKTVGGQSLLGAGNIPLTDQEAVKFTPQTLTDAQKAQALANIGAASEDEVAALADQKYEGPYESAASLPTASASTMGAIYLVGPDGNGEYDRYVTKLNGSTYTWGSLGKTSIDLSNYATKAEVGELEAKVNYFDGNYTENVMVASNVRLSQALLLPFTGKCKITMSVSVTTADEKWRIYRDNNGSLGTALIDYQNFGDVAELNIPDTDPGIWLYSNKNNISLERVYSVSISQIEASFVKRVESLEAESAKSEYFDDSFALKKDKYNTSNLVLSGLVYTGGVATPASASKDSIVLPVESGASYSVTNSSGRKIAYCETRPQKDAILFGYASVPNNGEIIVPSNAKYLMIIVDLPFTNFAVERITAIQDYYQGKINGINTQINNIDSNIHYELEQVYGGLGNLGADAKAAIKSFHYEKVDTSLPNPSSLYISTIQNTDNGRFKILIYAGDTYIAGWELATAAALSGVKTEKLTNKSGNVYGLDFYFTIDWDNVGDTNIAKSVSVDGISIDLSTANQLVQTGLPIHKEIENNRRELLSLSSPFKGKNIVCLGDSITEGVVRVAYPYPTYLSLFIGANVINCGVGGTRATARAEVTPTTQSGSYAAFDLVNLSEAIANEDFTTQIACGEYLDNEGISSLPLTIANRLAAIDWSSVDYIVMCFGVNDWISGAVLGQLTDGNSGELVPKYATSEFYGAYNKAIHNIMSAHKHIRVCIITNPVGYRTDEPYSSSFRAARWGSNYKNGNGATLEGYADATVELAKYNTVPVYDFYHDCGWNRDNFAQYYLQSDGVTVNTIHPSSGYDYMAHKIAAWLLSQWK